MENKSKAMASLLVETRKFPPPESVRATAYVNSFKQYQQMWQRSIRDPDSFWLEQTQSLTWFRTPTKGLEYTWEKTSEKILSYWSR